MSRYDDALRDDLDRYRRSLMDEFIANGVLYPYEAIKIISQIHHRDYLEALPPADQGGDLDVPPGPDVPELPL